MKEMRKTYEDHDIIFVVASDFEEAKLIAKSKTDIIDELHIDGIVCIQNIDGYSIELKKNNNDKIEFDFNYQKIN